MVRLIKYLLRGVGRMVLGTLERLFYAVIVICTIAALVAYATNYSMTQGSGTTFGSIVVGGVNYAQQFICDLTTPAQCASVSAGGAVKVDNSAVTQPGNVTQFGGTNVSTGTGASGAGIPRVTVANDSNVLATQSGTWNVGTLTTITNPVTVTQSTASSLKGQFDPLTIATWGLFAGQNQTSPTNFLGTGCQFNTTPTTITTGNVSPCQLDNAGNMLVNVKSATGLAQGSTTSGQTGSMVMGAVTTSAPSYTTAQTSPLSLDLAGNTRVNVAASIFSAAAGAAPPANIAYLGVNASGATGGHVAGLIGCDNHVFKHITSATDTLAVQGVASQTIYICGATGNAAGTATWFLENTASANANCASANTQITGVATEAANTRSGFYNPVWGGLKNTSGNGLCINSTGTGGVDVDIWYTQF